ncbi:hypothetical protein EDM80_10445 [bacterium]|nr:MAG: hypothetical protein EDM80_10445 [bacterium]
MEPKERTSQALAKAAQGDLSAAAEALNEICQEFREFGPAYTAHALVFLMAGDTAQAMTDLDAADWANQEYGTPEQLAQGRQLRLVSHAVRSIYGGQKEQDACRALCEELRKNTLPMTTWLLPAICYEWAWREADARKWIDSLVKVKELKGAWSQYWQKSAGWTSFLVKNPDLRELAPVHFARHLRAKREGDNSSAAKHLKRLQEVTQPLDAWAVLAQYASGAATVDTV